MDDRWKWLETRISSSLRPRNEELKNMFLNDENRQAFDEFINNEDVSRIFVYMHPPRQIIASLQPPHELKYKSTFFLKSSLGSKITKENIRDEVIYFDCTEKPLEHLGLLVREVYLPLMCTNLSIIKNSGGDKVMDVLHGLMSDVEIAQGHIEGQIILSLPSIEVLAEAAVTPNRRSAVLHVLETTILGWIKQIKGLLRHDPIQEIFHHFGPEPGPLDEIKLWERQLDRLNSILKQLESPVAIDILNNLEMAQSQFGHSFSHVRKDVNKAVTDTRLKLRFLSTMRWLLNDLHVATIPSNMSRLFKPLMNVLFLIWSNSVYYHQADKFQNILGLMSNEVVHRAIALVAGEDILRDPLESHVKLKQALRVCAEFRGTFLDFKHKADTQNQRNVSESAERIAARPQAGTLFLTKMYGPQNFAPFFGKRHSDCGTTQSTEDKLCADSPWPQRNSSCFQLLNDFIGRCNNLLELVETTRDFHLLQDAAEIGGAGNMSLDAHVKEIYEKYTQSMSEFFSVVDDVLTIDRSQKFDQAFFKFRTIVKQLEKRLAEILRLSYDQCVSVEAQLRLLEVFEGISGRELVCAHLEDKDRELVVNFTTELNTVRRMFEEGVKEPPRHANMPPIVSNLTWVHALQERINRPMEKMKQVRPQSLEGETGWHLRDNFYQLCTELEVYECKVIAQWRKSIVKELGMLVKKPLLIADECDKYDKEIEMRPHNVQVNLDPRLLLLMREEHYLSRDPFNIKLPEIAKECLCNSNQFELRVTATRLETIVSKYNTIMKTITAVEKPLFERKLAKIDILFEQGLHEYTWKMLESADFIEQAMALVCVDVHQNLDIVQTNFYEIGLNAVSWAKGTMDVFSSRDPSRFYSMEELLSMQLELTEEFENLVIPSGHKIHSLVLNSFEAVQISQASPDWQAYMAYIDAIVLDGLKQATLNSLKSMLNYLVQANTPEKYDVLPILTLRLELIDNCVAFRIPLDQNTSLVSVQERVTQWLDRYLATGKLVKMLGPKGSHKDLISADEEVQQLLADIQKLVEKNTEECKKLLELFADYSILWLQDVTKTFEEFLQVHITPNPLRSLNRPAMGNLRKNGQDIPTSTSRSSLPISTATSVLHMGTAERTFLVPKHAKNMPCNVPSLDDFDAEINVYRTARDEIQNLKDFHNVGWLRVNLQPLKQVLTAYAAKWMWTFTKYLSGQVTYTLDTLDEFLKRIEPEIEGITGEERDTASFMKMMRLFNEVSAEQSEMEGKFAAMNRTLLLLKKYDQKLPDQTQQVLNAGPIRWNNLRTKVSLAKQRLGPRIQEESVRITRDLEAFEKRVELLCQELGSSQVYNRECQMNEACSMINSFSMKLTCLENEAQDLIELQELLEASVVNFNSLPKCRHELSNLKLVWETVGVINEQQQVWKQYRWQKVRTRILREDSNKQLEIVRALPEDVCQWDIYLGLLESIANIQDCLPLIDDMSNPAMRPRHWKQLVRVTGGVLQIDNDKLKRMTLGELLRIGLHNHVDDVHALVQRAVKDLSIEQSLITYEEVWLSKVFQFNAHVSSKHESADVSDHDSQSAKSDPVEHKSGHNHSQSQTRTFTGNQTTNTTHNKRTSIASLPQSLIDLSDESGPHGLLANTDPIFEELECHQITLHAMQSNHAVGSFLDDVVKWQKKLQNIEAVLTVWLEVQEKWVELKEVYLCPDVRTALPSESNKFAIANRDFRLLMRATEKNPNVLQCCSRKNILAILEHTNRALETCRGSLLNHIQGRRAMFPRFYFLSMKDVMHIVCNGYDLGQVSMYVNKLFENIGSLMYEEVDGIEKYNFVITGVQSALGEKLEFQEQMLCRGQIESWLCSFVHGLKRGLQYQMGITMGRENKWTRSRTVKSEGSLKVTVPTVDSSPRHLKQKKTSSSLLCPNLPSRAPSVTDMLFQDGADDPHISWTFDHVTEVVYLATRVQMTQRIAAALDDCEDRAQAHKQPLKTVLAAINERIQTTTDMLKGIEGEKEKTKDKHRPEEEGADHSESKAEKQCTKPLMDTTMDLAAMSLPPVKIQNKTKEEVQEELEILVKKSNLKLQLLPSQIHKLMCLLTLLAHMRDYVERLLRLNTPSPKATIDWKSHLKYFFNKEDKEVSIQCLDLTMDYGFEYLGSTPREVITPLTERSFLAMTQAINSYMGVMTVGAIDNGKLELVQELSHSFGHAMYKFNCTKSMDYCGLQDIFRGMVSTGCWITFNNLNSLDPSVLSVFAQLLSTVLEALKSCETSVRIQSDDIQLNTRCACFALIDNTVPVKTTNLELLIFPSVTTTLLHHVMRQFRVVSVTRPDLHLCLEVLLTSQGFINGAELAGKTMTLKELTCKLLGTNTFVTESAQLEANHSAFFNGWSLKTLKGVVAEAGVLLERFTEEANPTNVVKICAVGEEVGEEQDIELEGDTRLALEKKSLVWALHDTFLPRMIGSDSGVFITLLMDLFPNVNLPMVFGWEEDTEDMMDSQLSNTSSKLKTANSHSSTKSGKVLDVESLPVREKKKSVIYDSIHINTPVVGLAHGDQSDLHIKGYNETLEDIHDAIAVATDELDLLPGMAFNARVAQLALLNAAHQTIFVVGPAGCGKSECIKTFVAAEKERDKVVDVQIVFCKAVESEELMGYSDPKTMEWKDGLFASLLRKFCRQPPNLTDSPKPVKLPIKIMQLDGKADPGQIELLQSVLMNCGRVVLGNNERIMVPDTLRFLWELESVCTLSPALLASVGIMVMSNTDVGWQLMLILWLEKKPDEEKELLTGFCDEYIYRTISYLQECTQDTMLTAARSSVAKYKRVIKHSIENMVVTFTNLLDTLVQSHHELGDLEFERYFNYACIWAFAGTLEVQHRESFSHWWHEEFGNGNVVYPEEGNVFDYLVDSDSHEFVRWSDNVPAYNGVPNIGIPHHAFVHTAPVEQMMTILRQLTDAGRSVLLVGEKGCGKTALVKERLRTVSSGEVAEVLSLSVQANRFTNSKLLASQLAQKLEWKHGKTYVAKGNKRLLCCVDDIHLSKVDKWHDQTAVELIRQHMDVGGFYNQDSHAWRYVENVTYISTININTSASVPKLSQRFLRHFALFFVPFPSNADLQTIFSTLTHTHFILPELTAQVVTAQPSYDAKASVGRAARTLNLLNAFPRMGMKNKQERDEKLKKLLSMIVGVTTDIHERLRKMFLNISQRCHYIFTVKDLSCIFKNMCLSLPANVQKKNLLLLWQHECYWVYGHRMGNDVDFCRFKQAFHVAVKKEFVDDEMVQTMMRMRQPHYSNLIVQDSGIVTAGMLDIRHNTKLPGQQVMTDLYSPSYNVNEVKDLMTKGMEEYNKINPRIKLFLYNIVIDQVCRFARTIASPHEIAHCMLVAEGSPDQSTMVVRLAAHLCGYTVHRISPSPLGSTYDSKMDQFKADLVQAYTRAGAKGEKILLLLLKEELLEEDFLVFLIEFIAGGAISHLFQHEEQTTIINSIRTEVTQAGLEYDTDVAWNFFLKTVRDNFRVCLISGDGGKSFQRLCREYPSFTKNVNFIWFPHWSKAQLVEHAMFHLDNVSWMSVTQRENVAYMLASMHLMLRQQDGGEQDSGQYKHVTNTAYEKFVERFISIANIQHAAVEKDHDGVATSLSQIRRENEVAIKLNRNLEHEMTVLEERKQGTIKILTQIGQDTAISEQQTQVVQAQRDKISKLKKLLPEYQVAHERAVYKSIAIVADTKKLVQMINIEKLHELRVMQKPIMDIEYLMASIIMILKSPFADLTWQKGAKRQMANIERFIEEMMSFDDVLLPESTLMLVEPYLKKPSFEPEMLEKVTGNSACGSLCKWVHGVVRYHRMMISKVKPLHQKVDDTASAVDEAQHKMETLENKKQALEVRLNFLAKGFGEATIDKMKQKEQTVKMKQILDTAAQLRMILKGERDRCQQIYDSHSRRLSSIPGGCAMAAGFATYLGPYHHKFRRIMLTIHWPNCLRERGIPLVIDSIDGLKGRVIDWSIDFLRTASGASQTYDILPDMTSQILNEDRRKTQIPQVENDIGEEGTNEYKGKEAVRMEGDTAEDTMGKTDQEPVDEELPDSLDFESPLPVIAEEKPIHLKELFSEDSILSAILNDDTASEISSMPALSSVQYNQYIKSLIKLLVGVDILNNWLKQDFGPRQMENMAMLCSSCQRPPMLIDPNEEGACWLSRLNALMNNRKLVSLDMETRWTDPNVTIMLEKAIVKGIPLLLRNCPEHIDNIITKLIHHINTAHQDSENEEPGMIRFCGRRILCHPDFHFYLSTPLSKPNFNPEIASSTTIINFGVSHDTLTEDLLSRAFVLTRPDLYKERIIALENVEIQKTTMLELTVEVRDKVLTNQEAIMGSAKAVNFIRDFTNAKVDLSNQMVSTESLLEDLELLKNELHPLAHRANLLYSIMHSLQSIHNVYQFSLAYFLTLFDEAVGGQLPEGFFQSSRDITDYDATGSLDKESEEQMEKSDPSTVSEHPSKQNVEIAKASSSTKKAIDGTSPAEELGEWTKTEELPALDLPKMATLPSKGVKYSSFSTDHIKELVDKLTGLVYRRIREGLYEEDCLLFATLLCLNIQSESSQKFSKEEMSLLLQGTSGLSTQLTLADFGCNASPPDWLPLEIWEGVLTLSVLPGPIDSLCVSLVSNSDSWKAWYKCDYVENEPLPVSLTSKCVESTKSNKSRLEKSTQVDLETEDQPGEDRPHSDLEPPSEFYQLLLIRMLRPDRLPVALTKYINTHLTCNLPEQEDFNLQDTLNDSKKCLGILLLLPESMSQNTTQPVTRLKMTHPPIDVLNKLAQTEGVSVDHVRIGEGSEVLVEDAIHIAEKKDGWVVIEDLHLAPDNFYHQLKKQLIQVYRSRKKTTEEKQKTSKFCVWITSEPNSKIPDYLILNLHKVAWNHITMDVLLTHSAGPTNGEESPLAIHYKSPQTYLHTAIVSTLKQIPERLWRRVAQEDQRVRHICFAIAIIQSVLVARQLFGSQGLSEFYPLMSVQSEQAITLVLSRYLRPEENVGSVPDMDTLTPLISQVIYENTVYSEFDQDYVWALVRNVLHSIHTDSSGALKLGTALIPTPPKNIEPMEYAEWYEKNVDEKFTLTALQLHTSVEKEACIASSTEFVRHMNQMFETQNMEGGDLVVSQSHVINIKRLRLSLDLCTEQLPPLLELGQMPDMQHGHSFPYHRPSTLSVATASSQPLPENLGYVLQQECLWMNCVVCQIRHEVSEIQGCLLGGVDTLPGYLHDTVLSLQEKHVPVSWVHHTSRPCTQTLATWLKEMRKGNKQLHGFIKAGMVHVMSVDHINEKPVHAHVTISSVWLAGLVKPEALLTALKQEQTLASHYSINDVVFECTVLESLNAAVFEPDEGGMFITNVYIQGAAWDYGNQCLIRPLSDLFNIPAIYLKPLLKTELQTTQSQQDGDKHKFNCPVFMNRSRQYLVCELQLTCPTPDTAWHLARTAIILMN